MGKGGIASIGECMLELSASGNRPGSNHWRMGFAGDTLNTLWALRALTAPGRAATYVSAFGDDPFSQQQIAFFAGRDIGIGESPVIAGARPGLYTISLDGAERSFVYWRSDSAAKQLASDPQALAASLAGQALVYFSGITLAILDKPARKTLFSALKAARRAGSTLAFDPNYRPRLWREAAEAQAANAEALALADIALPTFPDEKQLYGDATPEATLARMVEAGIGEIVVKNGPEEAFCHAEGTAMRIAAEKVVAKDTTGAGDAFNGAYLAARLAGDSAQEAVRRAHRVAAAVVQVRGALAPFSTLRKAFGGLRPPRADR